MSQFTKRIVLFGCLIAIGMFIGMQLATSGIENIYGPGIHESAVQMEPQAPIKKTDIAERKEQAKQVEQVNVPQTIRPVESNPPVDQLADKTAGLLQQLSQKGIRFVVSLFSSVTE
ncbi:hypothetical protein PASE110613_03380 [Paenibacillus sediminis]|uniref:DUF3679 domain-containing protein n=1 Tax=Paenibacillus sediminis TaxID=664909 RepID=A0ABS4GYN6_9BACL|nr:hypothetical protein [Paenibacillus sediminis]MBP1935369.1 hypothetical protein [Paenibacillus sediminis]